MADVLFFWPAAADWQVAEVRKVVVADFSINWPEASLAAG
jgi:hypothetical protein